MAACFVSFSVQAKTNIQYIVDFSGSMKKVSEGETQIAIAKKALIQSLENIPSEIKTALRVYGHRVEQTNKTESCKDSEVVAPFSNQNVAAIRGKVAGLNPKGYTPIAYSLEQSQHDFPVEDEAKKVIILLSDGEETCGGDPVAVLKKLKSQGFEVVVHTIGFNVDAKTRGQLQAIAKETGGDYFDANGVNQLNKALKDATQQSYVVEKEKSTYGEAIQGGNSYETAVVLPVNKELTLNHHQKKNDYDYFALDLKTIDDVTIEIHTLEKGVQIREGKVKENLSPYMGFEFHGDKRNRLYYNSVSGKHQYKTYKLTPDHDGRYYILIGNNYGNQHKDHSSFKITKVTKDDLGSGKDAGTNDATAINIDGPGRFVAHMGGSDQKDTFVINAKSGEKYTVGVIPKDDVGSYFYLKVYDEFKQPLLKANSKTANSGFKSGELTIEEDGKLFLELSLNYGTQKTLAAYTLVVKKAE